jgi:hypothetical protein
MGFERRRRLEATKEASDLGMSTVNGELKPRGKRVGCMKDADLLKRITVNPQFLAVNPPFAGCESKWKMCWHFWKRV